MAELVFFSTLALVMGVVLDAILGDPKGWPHLIKWFGRVIAYLEKKLYSISNKRLSGKLLVVAVLLLCGGIPALMLAVSWRISPWLFLALESLLCWQLLASKSLRDESMPVYDALKNQNVKEARAALSWIVGRDTAALDDAGIARAAVETVAENTADGVAAPLLYITLGGAALGCVYKAVNTMDSMVGYRNQRYEQFGRCAARLDDVLNYIPARICALVMMLTCPLCGLSAQNAWRIWRRDRHKHASPNSAQTEAVMAGALGVQLAGDAWYAGKLYQKPTIGDAARPIEAQDIRWAHRMLLVTSLLLLLLSILLRGILY
ncbi:MAG: cobalamin biosynthesis protein CobD, partial [Clostridiales bacterium]|nr:cobalamin biosynthesis protein CobD [Clostridiales bacterium]